MSDPITLASRYISELQCPSCAANLGVEYDDVSGSNEGSEPYNCYNCGKGLIIETQYIFSVELANPDLEE